MIEEIAGSKWIAGLYPDTPCVLAAKKSLSVRLKAVERMMKRAANPPNESPEYVHQLRVSSRRAAAALKVFRNSFRPEAVRRARKELRAVRRAAAAARSLDVHRELLSLEAKRAPSEARKEVAAVLEQMADNREKAQKALKTAHTRLEKAQIRSNLAKALLLPAKPGRSRSGGVRIHPEEQPYTLGALLESVLPPLTEEFARQARADLDETAALHQLRIAAKKLRYVLELSATSLPAHASGAAYRELVKMQSRLGRINDYAEAVARVSSIVKKQGKVRDAAAASGASNGAQRKGMSSLAEHLQSQFARHCRRFLRWFDELRRRKITDALEALLAVHPVSAIREGSGRRNQAAVKTNPPASSRHRRVAAVDVGTNSIRMAVAETDPAIGFRIIEDVKETTRLGTGVYRSGKLKVGAVKRSMAALERMRSIANGYNVDSFRAVATSAIRESANGTDFVKLVRRRLGIPIEVIPPRREARLAFSGVSRDFDLSGHRIAVVDTGGGSTEVVFASSGVIDAVRPLSLGSVRLTEAFERENQPGQYRFGEMKRRINKVVRKSIRRVPYRPEYIVGAGGTFTSLARVALREGVDAGKAGYFPFAVRGCELRHKTVLRILKSLRRMTLEERSRVSGLSAKRAEIIVAGLCIVERLMRFLKVDRLVVHDGGIRDGLVAEMIDELGYRSEHPRTHPEQVLGAVGRYAERMKFPRQHSEHVAKLALRIFDWLAELQPDSAGSWARPAHRDLLHGAALLHDVGRRIGIKAHHKHAYDMIIHADLATLTRREIEIIAQTCRYHRKTGPRREDPGFRKLGADDQRLVAHLVGILRIADALDYSQRQHVTDVNVRIEDDTTVFEITACDDVRSELERAAEKGDVFESAFRTKTKFLVHTAARELAAVC